MHLALSLEQQEAQFIQACIRKERWAQEKLYNEYYSPMLSVCLRYANNDDEAKDILHEGFIKVFRNLRKYNPGTSMNAWIRRIMVNTSIDFYRKKVRRRTEDIDHAQHKSVSEADALSQVTEKEILAALQSLSPAYRTVFNMYVIEGFSHKEIGKTLNITESTSRSNLVKARAKLKDMIAPKLPTQYGE